MIFVGSKRVSLGILLERLTKECAEYSVRRVFSVGIGHEDEGPELDKWRRQAGSPMELTIYCEQEGDVASFGPFADMVEWP